MSYQLKLLLLTALVVLPNAALAHQPRIVDGDSIAVADPEISKAYYATPHGSPQVYRIHSTTAFPLYVNILVPDIAGQKTDVVAKVIDLSKPQQPLAVLGGTQDTWKKFFEPFGYDTYLMGAEYKADVAAGDYEVHVSSPSNDTAYSLAIGEKEMFNWKEGLNALTVIPQIKQNFFHKSPASFIFSTFGWGEILVLFACAFACGFAYRFALRKLSTHKARGAARNIGTADRWLRAALGTILFAVAISTSWNPLLLFVSGFCFFEAIFSWCGLFAALGKNSCPV